MKKEKLDLPKKKRKDTGIDIGDHVTTDLQHSHLQNKTGNRLPLS